MFEFNLILSKGSQSNASERVKAFHFAEQVLQEELGVGAALKVIDGDDDDESTVSQFWADMSAKGPVWSSSNAQIILLFFPFLQVFF